MNELLAALGNFDTQLYLAIAEQRNIVTSIIAVALTYLNWDGFFWWILAFLLLRSRGLNRRGIAATATVVLGMVDAWAIDELIKLVVRRPRPFEALANAPSVLPAPETVVAHPSSYSFPSGDAALAMGAAVAFAYVTPKYRVPILLLGISAALARVVVGVHYPFDVLGGMTVGLISGLLAPQAIALLRRRLRWRALVIPHTHWDREWYERFEGYRARLVPMVSRLLDLLEREGDFRSFTFDGQTIAIQDYLEKRPADVPRVQALVKADRLLIGPWHVLADLLLVSGESIVRNLQEGLRSAGELGRAARVAYVADPFGHPAQLPQILRAFGYDTYVFARGMGDEGESVGSEFWWVSPSGDRVRAAHLVDHYSNALPLVGPPDEDAAALRHRVKAKTGRILDRLTPYANGDVLLLMVGDDHVDAYARLPEAVREMRQAFPNVDARIASLEEFAAVMPPLQHEVSGEITSGRYRPILRGVNSTRVWIKQENVACERLLLEWCEPLDALTGGTARDELRDLWRMLLQNHPHDSICGCSIDAVHDVDMAPRFAYVREHGDELAARLLERLAGRGSTPMLWNPLPWARDAVVPVDERPTRVRLSGLGLSPVAAADGAAAVKADGDTAIENGLLRVEVEADGSFFVVDKATGERGARQNRLISEGDRGDEYTYSYAGPTVGSEGLPGTRATAVAGDRATATVEFVLRLPARLRDDRLARSPELVDCPVRVEISLDAGERRVDVTLEVDNRASDHRLRVLCETGTRALTHQTGAAFALLERSNRFEVRKRWIEPPTSEACVHDFIAVKGATKGLAVGVDGLREYSVLHDGATIAITLLRAVGFLSRGDLPERRGHAGPELATPSAQCIGSRSYRYAVVPLDEQTDVIGAARSVREWLSPPLVISGDGRSRSFVSFVEPSTPLVLSALRAGPDGALVLRIANPAREEVSGTLRFGHAIRDSRPVDLREGDLGLGNTGLDVIRTAAPLEVDGAVARARLQPYEIGTWLVQLG
ncbi:MAG TPA: phosphatase PAP2 family protein [Candidatus Polarisedimenticolia bacterium]|nr:phosphatase PAP2 family protein [Candidatus Polarisedimenticolia bacterium]